MTRPRTLWIVAVTLFVLGLALQSYTRSVYMQNQAAMRELETMQTESRAVTSTTSAPIALATLAQQVGLAVQLEPNAQRTTVRFEGAAANAVIAFLTDAERAGGQRILRASLAFVAPGVVNGSAELVAR